MDGLVLLMCFCGQLTEPSFSGLYALAVIFHSLPGKINLPLCFAHLKPHAMYCSLDMNVGK